MQKARRFVQFLLINLLIFFVVYIGFNGFYFASLHYGFIAAVCTFFVLLGLFLGLCIDLWRENDAVKKASYQLGLYISSAGFFLLLICLFYFTRPEPKTNEQSNNDDLAFGLHGQHEKEGRIAYHALIKKFNNANAIRLDGGSSDYLDSNSQGYVQRFFVFRFKYYINNNSTLYVSKLMVHDTIPEFVFFNRVAATDTATIRHDSSRSQFFHSIEGLKQVISDTGGTQ